MSRDSFDATRRLLRRIITVLEANMATQLAADKYTNTYAIAPAADAYYVKRNERAVREHQDDNHKVMVCVYPSSERTRAERTSTGPTTKSIRTFIDVTVAVRVLDELGGPDIVETWKTLTPDEREFWRCETFNGAVMDIMDANARHEDDIHNMVYVEDRSGDDRFSALGTWGSVTYNFEQTVLRPVQTAQ